MMHQKKNPSYRQHSSGQAIVTLPDGPGRRRDFLLGAFGSRQSHEEYDRLIAAWRENEYRIPKNLLPSTDRDITIAELIARFWEEHASTYYRHPDGTPTSEQPAYKISLRPLRELYGNEVARNFDVVALETVRQAMIGSGLCRSVIDQRIGRITRMFQWASSKKLYPGTLHAELVTLPTLKRGRSSAHETEPVKPVTDAAIEATLPFLLDQVAAMVRLQRQSGMRPGEVVLIRGIDLDMSGPVWRYRPGSDQGPHGKHKTAWRGHSKTIALGPKAQEIIKPWLRLNVTEYLFQPAEAMAAFTAQRRQTRKTKVQPSQKNRRTTKPKRRPGVRYTTSSYGHAVAKAIAKANKASACEACKTRESADRCDICKASSIPHWHPHQIRHTRATEIRREYGLDAARAVLGHRSPAITEVYAEIDVNKAAEVMAKLG